MSDPFDKCGSSAENTMESAAAESNTADIYVRRRHQLPQRDTERTSELSAAASGKPLVMYKSIAEYEKKLARLNQDNFDLRLYCYNLEEKAKRTGLPIGTTNTGNSNSNKILELQSEIRELKDNVDRKAFLLTKGSAALDQLNSELQAALDDKTKLCHALGLQDCQIEELMRENGALCAASCRLEQQLRCMEEQCMACEARALEFEEAFRECTSKAAVLKSRLCESAQTVEELTADRIQLEIENSGLRGRWESSLMDTRRLNEALSHSGRQLTKTQAKVGDLKEQLRQLNEENENLKRQLSNWTAKREDLDSAARSDRSQLNRLEEENRVLTEQLQALPMLRSDMALLEKQEIELRECKLLLRETLRIHRVRLAALGDTVRTRHQQLDAETELELDALVMGEHAIWIMLKAFLTGQQVSFHVKMKSPQVMPSDSPSASYSGKFLDRLRSHIKAVWACLDKAGSKESVNHLLNNFSALQQFLHYLLTKFRKPISLEERAEMEENQDDIRSFLKVLENQRCQVEAVINNAFSVRLFNKEADAQYMLTRSECLLSESRWNNLLFEAVLIKGTSDSPRHHADCVGSSSDTGALPTAGNNRSSQSKAARRQQRPRETLNASGSRGRRHRGGTARKINGLILDFDLYPRDAEADTRDTWEVQSLPQSGIPEDNTCSSLAASDASQQSIFRERSRRRLSGEELSAPQTTAVEDSGREEASEAESAFDIAPSAESSRCYQRPLGNARLSTGQCMTPIEDLNQRLTATSIELRSLLAQTKVGFQSAQEMRFRLRRSVELLPTTSSSVRSKLTTAIMRRALSLDPGCRRMCFLGEQVQLADSH